MPLEAFAAELRKRRLHHRLWLEIEGIGDTFGNFSADSSWWPDLPGFPARERFDRVLDLAAEVPNFSSQQLDHAGGRVSLGTCGVVIAERDGVLHRLFATRRPGLSFSLDRAIERKESVSYAFFRASQSEWDALPESGDAYIGRETVGFLKYSYSGGEGVLRLVYRGKFRSRIIEHPVGSWISLHPTILADRRVWLWWGLGDDITNSMMVFSGHLESVRWRDGGTALELQCADEQGNSKTPLFREAFLWLSQNDPPVLESDKIFYGDPDDPMPDFDSWYLVPDAFYQSGWDDEIRPGEHRFLLVSRATDSSPTGQVVLVEGDDRESKGGPNGSPARVAWVRQDRTIVQAEPLISKVGFSCEVAPCLLITPPKTDKAADGADWREHVIWKRGTHPLQVELQLLLSKNGDGANGYWDVLPPGYGYGIDEKRVDLDSFEALIDRTGDLRVETVITAPVDDGREWRIKNLYQPFGFYPRLVFGGRYSVGFIGDPPAHFVENAHVITEDQIISWEGPGTRKRDVVDSFTFKADARISLEPPHEVENRDAYVINGMAAEEVRFVDEVTDAGPADNATGRSVDVDCVTVHNLPPEQKWRVVPIPVFTSAGPEQGAIVPSTSLTAQDVAEKLRSYIERRFRTPHSYLNLKLRIEDAPISVGDLVRVHARAIPNTASGTPGLNGELFEVVERTLNLSETTVDLVLAQSDATVEERVARSLGPALEVRSYDNVLFGWYMVEANKYTQAPDKDVDAFVFGTDPDEEADRCIIVRADRSEWSSPFVLSFRGDTEVDGAIMVAPSVRPEDLTRYPSGESSWPFQPGDVIIYADRASCTPRQRRLYLFAAKPSLRFSDGDDAQGWA